MKKLISERTKMFNEKEIFLKMRGIYISPLELMQTETHIIKEFENKKMTIRSPAVLHIMDSHDIRDVAVARMLAFRYNLQEGVDWSWSRSSDGYHCDIGYSLTPSGKQLYDLMAEYLIADIREAISNEGINLNELIITGEAQ